MPSDVHRLRYVFPKLEKGDYRVFMKTLKTALGFGVSEKAKFRLHCIKFFQKNGWERFHDAFPGVSRPTVYRWRKRLTDSGGCLNSLVPCSTRPQTTRQMTVPAQVLLFLKAMRRQHPHLSKYKLKVFLDEWCRQQELPVYSVSWIGKIIARYQLFFSVRKPVRRRRKRSRSGYTIYRTPSPEKLKLGYLQLDGVILYYLGRRLVFLTALEVKTRKAWVKLVPTASSLQARNFLLSILATIPFKVWAIHTDNGSEFHALFDQAVVQLGLTHLWSPARTPKVHSHVERFNGVFQEEFVNYSLNEILIDQKQFNKRLEKWLSWYNSVRPHHSLGLLSPDQYLLQLQEGGKILKCV